MCTKSEESSAKSSTRISSSVVLVWAMEIEDTSIGSEPDVDTFAQFFLSLSQHHAEEDGIECRRQHAALFHAVSNEEGVRKAAAMFDWTLLAFMELLNDGEAL